MLGIGVGKEAGVWIDAGIARARGVGNTINARTVTMVRAETGHEAWIGNGAGTRPEAGPGV